MNRLTLAALLLGGLGLVGWGPPPVSAQVASADARPAGVSPGALEAFAAAAPCPTFSWTAVPAAAGYELRVYGVDQLGQPESAPAIQARIPGGATCGRSGKSRSAAQPPGPSRCSSRSPRPLPRPISNAPSRWCSTISKQLE